jgi:hypothetical protein
LARSEAGAILPGRPFQKAGPCLPFYNQRWHSLKHFERYREHVLDRDGHACGGQEWIIVHHRAHVQDPDLMIALCAACHARVYRLLAIPACVLDVFLLLWEELHPRRTVQFQFDLAA